MRLDFVSVTSEAKREEEVSEIFGAIEERYLKEKNRLNDILKLIPTPFTVIIEDTYVCQLYRDSYYKYYSSQFEEKDRYCVRITIFSCIIEQDKYLEKEYNEIIEKNIVGFITLRPLTVGNIGKTVLNPQKLKIPECYIRLTKYKFMVGGRRLEVEGFGFVSQDNETMTCSECSIYSLAEYYGTQYNEYKMILPNEILKFMSSQSFERVLPSKGAQKEQISRVLVELGFQPRLYNYDEDNENQSLAPINQKRLLYYYIESGIPVIVYSEKTGNSINE